jgi:hypothetical protein
MKLMVVLVFQQRVISLFQMFGVFLVQITSNKAMTEMPWSTVFPGKASKQNKSGYICTVLVPFLEY